MTNEEKISRVEAVLEGREPDPYALSVADIKKALQGVPDDMPVRNHHWQLLQTVAALRKELADRPDDQVPRDKDYGTRFTFAMVVDGTRGSMKHEPTFVLGHHEPDPQDGDLRKLIHYGF